MNRKEEASEKALLDGLLDCRISCKRLPLQKMKRKFRRYHKSGGKRSESCIQRKKSGWDYQKKGT